MLGMLPDHSTPESSLKSYLASNGVEDKRAQILLCKLLEIDPEKRITAQQAKNVRAAPMQAQVEP